MTNLLNRLTTLMRKNMGHYDSSSSMVSLSEFNEPETLENRIDTLEGQLAVLNRAVEDLEDVLGSILKGYLVVKLEAVVEEESDDEESEDTEL